MYENHSRKEVAHQLLNVLWGSLTVVFLLLVLYFIWRQELFETRKQLSLANQTISGRVEKLAHDIGTSINNMYIHGTNFNDCQKSLLPNLQKLTFNDPRIAGIVITNSKNQIICGTVAKIDSIPKANKYSSLVGPLQIANADNYVYIFSQPLGKYYIYIFLLKEELERLLKTRNPIAKTIGLFNSNANKMILQIERKNTKSPWTASKTDFYLPAKDITSPKSTMILSDNLIGLKDLSVIINADENTIKKLAWRYVSIASIIILLLSFIIYYYLRRLIQQHFSLHRAIIGGLKQNSFFPVYQPVIDRRKNICCGAEVLLRWHASKDETIMPDSFIEYAELSGLIVPITIQLVEKVFTDSHKMLASNPSFHLSINLSANHFTDEKFIEQFKQLCKKHKVSLKQIMLEVTERDLLQDDINLIKVMKKLRKEGVSIAIDDFGTGHASISYLQHFPFNYLKIDRLFVSAIGTGAVTESLNQAIIHMAKMLDLNVIAEGVETFQQLETLEEHGVYLIQGWYFSKALSFEGLESFIKRNYK